MPAEKKLLEIGTKAFGKVILAEEEIIRFPEGLYGFSSFTDFILLKESEESYFQWLQCVSEPDLAFIVIEPEKIFKKPYIPEISLTEKMNIGIDDFSNVKIYLIVTIPENHPEKMTVNLQGPLIVNPQSRKGWQVISMNENHSVRHPVLGNSED